MTRRHLDPVLPAYEDHVGLWRDELASWLPESLFDAHVHIGPRHLVGPVAPGRQRQALCTYMACDRNELHHVHEQLYGGKTVSGIAAFPFPQREVDLEGGNEYIVRVMRHEPSVYGFLLAHPTNAELAIATYEKARRSGVRFRGVKPYSDRLGKSNFAATMPEYIPEQLLAFMERERLVMMLHTSGMGVGDAANQAYLRRITGQYPHVRIILAHMGRYVRPEQFLAFMDSGLFDACPSLYLGTSSATCPEVYARVLERESRWRRLLFGSDMPFGLITGVERWSEERGAIFLSRDEYAWSDPAMNERFAPARRALTYNTYHMIKAFKDALQASGIGASAATHIKEHVFRLNALALFAPPAQSADMGRGAAPRALGRSSNPETTSSYSGNRSL